MTRCIPRDTKDWILDASDEKAAAAGMVMDLEAAQHAIEWTESHCRLYEGDRAGELIELMPYQRAFWARLFGWRKWNAMRGRWVRRFRKASMWAPKKSGKTPALAALELYVLAGDGEHGQKVYTAAKDGDQARIAQLQAFKMVEQSPELFGDCKLYANTLEIKYLPTDSFMKVLSSGTERNKQAKEGLNGSVFWDEMHVVDSGLVSRVSRAGISRAEPLDVSVSTAGQDVNCEGKARFDYGRQVASGQRDDLQFLHVEYCAPDGLTEEEFCRDRESMIRYGKAANPAWGIIIDPEEFLADAMTSMGDPTKFAEFMTYRLNVWMRSSSRWLDPFGWNEGHRAYLEHVLGGAA